MSAITGGDHVRVGVDVIATLIAAVHLNGNATVIVIRPADETQSTTAYHVNRPGTDVRARAIGS